MTMIESERIIIIPDVHGRPFWKEAVKDLDSSHVVFLGDYLDPYPTGLFGPPEIGPEEVIRNFREILKLKISAPDKVTLLLGNHDCEYLYGRNVCDCRCDHANYDLIQSLFRENKGYFQLAAESRRGGRHYVFVHAGIQKGWMDRHVKGWTPENMVGKLNRMNARALRREFPERTRFAAALSETDRWRCGEDDWGSPVWADAEAMNDGPWIEEVVQVVGHTAAWLADLPVLTPHVIYADCGRALVLGPRGGLRYTDGRRVVNEVPDPFHPEARPGDDWSFGVDWFQRPFCRKCGSHNVFLRHGMWMSAWICKDCHNHAYG